MSIRQQGMDSRLESKKTGILVPDTCSLIMLANALPWQAMADLVFPDLKKTARRLWWVGRGLQLRIHLAVFILQSRYNYTDREMEEHLRYNAAFQQFCGRSAVPGWHVPDHTATAKFRVRLQPETQRQLLVLVVKTAEARGLADPSWMDVDSTVQEANISYPSDATLMVKLAGMGKKVSDWLKKKTRGFVPDDFGIDMEDVSGKAKDYFFLAKNTVIEKKRKVFRDLHKSVKRQVYQLVDLLESMDERRLSAMPWNIRRAADTLLQDSRRYLLDVGHFIRTGSIKSGKRLSLHATDIACIVKGKLGKKCEFGRVFQLGRIGGNFLIPLACESVRMEDKSSLIPMIEEHARMFGKGRLLSLGTDKGYYSKANTKDAFRLGVQEIGIPCPGKVKVHRTSQDIALAENLRDRRAGIEPLIGHAKAMGLGRSRMKSDKSTLASGYRSVLGFNLLQMERHLSMNLEKTK